MKNYIILLPLFIVTLAFAQKQSFSVSILQYGKEVKIKKRQANLDKAPFVILYKFRGGSQYEWSLVAGSNEAIQDAYISDGIFLEDFIHNSASGGADGYFNTDKSIRAWDGEICTTILYDNDTLHRFDSLYVKGKNIYGFRTVEELSTKDDNLLVEDWKDDSLIIVTALIISKHKEFVPSQTKGIQLNFNTIENEFPYTVRGKEYIEEGEATFEEGCEGCGNLGSYKFLSNGMEVDFFRSGSDTGGFGEYKQIGDQVIIIEGELSFTVSPDGSFMTHNKYGTIYNLVKK